VQNQQLEPTLALTLALALALALAPTRCTHGDAGESVAASIEDSLVLICNYIDNLVQCVRPRRLV